MAWPPKPAFERIDDAVKGDDWVRVGSVLWPLSFRQGHQHHCGSPSLGRAAGAGMGEKNHGE